MTESKLLTVPKAAKMLGVSAAVVRTAIEKNQVDVVEIGSRVYVTFESIDRLLNKT